MYIHQNTWGMRFEWDEFKNRQNVKRHEIWFEQAQTVWADRQSVEFFDPEHSEKKIGLYGLAFQVLADY